MKNLILLQRVVVFFFIVTAASVNCFQGPLVTVRSCTQGIELTTLYGTTMITEPVLIELITHPAFERLAHIRQYGVMWYARSEYEFTRYEHSLGVFFITRLFGASLEEQIDALCHDISHTIMSHVGDAFFKSNYRTGLNAYQDDIHEWHLQRSGVISLLMVHGFADACSPAAKKHHLCFDQRLPFLGADRIEYNITGAYIDGFITKEEARALINDLRFTDNQWFFVTLESAIKFGVISLLLSETRWGATWSAVIDYSAAQALKRACELDLITLDDIHFSIDETIWQRLSTSEDPIIQEYIATICHYNDCYHICQPEEGGILMKGKFSGTDPLVQTEQGLCHVTTLDERYAQEFARVKTKVNQGAYVKIGK